MISVLWKGRVPRNLLDGDGHGNEDSKGRKDLEALELLWVVDDICNPFHRVDKQTIPKA